MLPAFTPKAQRAAAVAAILLGVPALASAARAHDLWIERLGSSLVLQYGHHGGEALPIDPKKIRSLLCRTETGRTDVLKTATPGPKRLVHKGACTVLSAHYDGGVWSLTPDGEKNLPKNEVPDAVKAWRSKQFAKWIDVRARDAAVPQGDELEIVAVTELANVKTGDKATFRVLLGGHPVEGAVVAIAHKPLGETDDKGEVRVRIRAADVESVSATYRRAVQAADADSEVFEATLTFEVVR